MGFVTDTLASTGVGGILGLESAGERAAGRSADALVESGQLALEELQKSKTEGQGFLQPFQQLGEQGLAQASFLTDPQAQFDFLQNNPLFQLGLDNANTQTNQLAAARGRLSAGDTLQQLNQNALLTASPLIQQQKSSIQDLLSRGFNTGQAQANTALGVGSQLANAQTDIGSARAGGIIGQQNARAAGQQNLLDIAGLLAGGL